MLKYFLNRVLQLIPVILGVTLLVFLVMKMASGDPARLILGLPAWRFWNILSEEQICQQRSDFPFPEHHEACGGIHYFYGNTIGPSGNLGSGSPKHGR